MSGTTITTTTTNAAAAPGGPAASPAGRGGSGGAGDPGAPPRERPLAVRVAEAARLLDIGRSKAYELIRRGELPAIRVGKTVRVPLAALEAWVRCQADHSLEEAP